MTIHNAFRASQSPGWDAALLSRAGFRGGLEARILSSQEETLCRHGLSEEVPR
jgi:hypothetical protein